MSGLKKKRRTAPFAVPLSTMVDAIEGWLARHGCRDIPLLMQELLGNSKLSMKRYPELTLRATKVSGWVFGVVGFREYVL